MADPLELLQSALQMIGKAREVGENAPNLPSSLKYRLANAESVLQQLQRDPVHVAHIGIELELAQLNGLRQRLRPKMPLIELQQIDEEIGRVLTAILAKGATGSSLPNKAAVPIGALALPRSYVEQPSVQEAAAELIKPEEPIAPYIVVGMGGGGKTVLASAVVRKMSVREYFRGGIFWIRAGRGAKNSLLPLLQGLVKEMDAAPTDTLHAVSHVLDSLEKVKQHLTAVASTRTLPRLVVLDNVWEREVVDTFLPLGLKLLVTTRDRSVVGVPGRLLELGDMGKEEALELLLKTSMTEGQPGNDVRAQMTKVAELCGRLPLALAIAGSMPLVKGKGLETGAWEKLILQFEKNKIRRARGEQSVSLDMVLGTSFDALSTRKQQEFLRMAVLATGAVAPIEMLLNLWEMKDVEGTRNEAEALVHKSLLQDVGGGGYRVHDLVLNFLKSIILLEPDVVEKATVLQAQYLGRLDVVRDYAGLHHGASNKGLFLLGALWRSVEELSGDPGLEVASYSASLRKLESSEASAEVANIYSSVGLLFGLQGKYDEAGPFYEHSLAIREEAFGLGHPAVAESLSNCAKLMSEQGKYDDAGPLYERSQAIREKVLGPDHPDVAQSLSDRAGLLIAQGKYDDAEPLYERSQAIREKVLGPEHPDVAQSLNNRAVLLEKQGKYKEADFLCLRAIEIEKKTLGLDHPNLAATLNNRAVLLRAQGKYAEAEALHWQSQEIREKVLGPQHPDIATTLNDRAELLERQGMYAKAEPLLTRATEIWEKTLGPQHPLVATALNNRARLLKTQGLYDEADCLLERAIFIFTAALGPSHPKVASVLLNQAELLEKQGKYDQAESLLKRSMAIREEMLGSDHPDSAVSLSNMARVLTAQHRHEEAKGFLERALTILEATLGRDHPYVATVLINQAELLTTQGKFMDAKARCERALDIQEKTLGCDHPDVATSLHELAGILEIQNKYDEAEPLYRRSLAIRENSLGLGHPSVAKSLNSMAGLLVVQRRYREAEDLYKHALSILETAVGRSHPDSDTVRHNWASLLENQGRHKEALDISQVSADFPVTGKPGRKGDLPPGLGDGLQDCQRTTLKSLEMAGATELHRAVYDGELKLVEELLNSRRFSPDIRWEGFGSTTPLHHAVQSGRADIVRLLFRHHAKPDLQNSSGWSALHMASKNDSLAMVKLLLDSGADVSIRTKDELLQPRGSGGWSALHIASARECLEMVRLLLDWGADPCIKDNRNIAPKGWLQACHVGDSLEHQQKIEELSRLLTPGQDDSTAKEDDDANVKPGDQINMEIGEDSIPTVVAKKANDVPGGRIRQDEDFAIFNPDFALSTSTEMAAECGTGNTPTFTTVSTSQGRDVHGHIYGSIPKTLGGRVLAMIAGRAGMSFNPPSTEETAEVYVAEEEALDLVVALTSRSADRLYTSNVCGENVATPLVPNDPSMMEIAADKMSRGFTKDFRRRSFIAQEALGFEVGSCEDLPVGAEGSLWSLLLASGKALGGSYHDLCVIALMDCTELTFVEAGVCAPTTGLLATDFLLATLSALTTKAGGRRVSLTSRCYCSALLQRYACFSLAPAMLEFRYTEGFTSMEETSGAVNLFWAVAGFVFNLPVSSPTSNAHFHSFGPVCDLRTSLPVLQSSPAVRSWQEHPSYVGAIDPLPKLLDFEPIRRVMARVVAAEAAVFGEGAKVLLEAVLPKDICVAPVRVPSSNHTDHSTRLKCPYDPRALAKTLGQGATFPGWDASQRAAWVVYDWDNLAEGTWSAAGLEAMSLLLRFGTSCAHQVEYARSMCDPTDDGVMKAMDNLDPQPWAERLDAHEAAGLRGLICLIIDAENANSDLWAGKRVRSGMCYGPIASAVDCGRYTSMDRRGSPIIYGLRVLRGNSSTSVEYGKEISGFTYRSHMGPKLWHIKVERSFGRMRTLHIKERPSSSVPIAEGEAKEWNFKVNGLIGMAAAL